MRKTCFEGRDCMCVGETPFVTPELAQTFINPSEQEMDMIFQFELMDIDSGKSGKWEIVDYDIFKFKDIISQWQKATKAGWGSLFWSNHDQPRPVSRFGSVDRKILHGKASIKRAETMPEHQCNGQARHTQAFLIASLGLN